MEQGINNGFYSAALQRGWDLEQLLKPDLFQKDMQDLRVDS